MKVLVQIINALSQVVTTSGIALLALCAFEGFLAIVFNSPIKMHSTDLVCLSLIIGSISVAAAHIVAGNTLRNVKS